MTWGDHVILQPKYKELEDLTERKIQRSDVDVISLKLGPTYPGSSEALFCIDLDLKENIITKQEYPEDIRQPFLDKIVAACFRLYGPSPCYRQSWRWKTYNLCYKY